MSHITIYRRITKNKEKGGKRQAGRSLIPERIDNRARPDIVEHPQRIGDWKGDTVFGQDAYLVTLVGRKSRLTLIGKVTNKTAITIANEIISLLK